MGRIDVVNNSKEARQKNGKISADRCAASSSSDTNDDRKADTPRHNSADPALDEDMTTAREIARRRTAEPSQKPIVSINGRDIAAQDFDEAA